MPSSYFRQEMFASQTGEALLCRMVIDPMDGSEIIRVINNFEDITIGSDVYTAFPFAVTFPEEKDDSPFSASIEIGAVDRQFIQLIRQLSDRPKVTLALIMSSYPETDEHGPYTFELLNVDWDSHMINGTLVLDDEYNEPYPGDKFNPGSFPGLFT